MFEGLKETLRSRRQWVPVEQLLHDATGSRMPEVNAERLSSQSVAAAVSACPAGALSVEGTTLALDYGRCTGCERCIDAGGGALRRATEFSLAGLPRPQLVRRWDVERRIEITEPLEETSRKQILSAMGRALNIRQLDPGSCNGCEIEIAALTSPVYDLERFGIHFVASPKHADMLLVTGPVTRNMEEAVRKTYEAVPAPKLVVAVGACGVSCGPFAGSHAVAGPVDAIIPVDAYIPGCPPTPAMLVAGILRVLGQAAGDRQARPGMTQAPGSMKQRSAAATAGRQ